MVELVVVSTGKNAPTKYRCLDSVAQQEGGLWHHIYLEADCKLLYDGRPGVKAQLSRLDTTDLIPGVLFIDDDLGALRNFSRVVRALPPDTVVAWLDGDDWLARPDALCIIRELYRDPNVWVTYGSYRFHDGSPGHAREWPWSNENPTPISRPLEKADPLNLARMSPRRLPWFASHLKTFRAGLFQNLTREELSSSHCRDMAVMFPLLEMAGPERSRYVPEVLYVYNYKTAWERTATKEARIEEKMAEMALRTKAPRERLDVYAHRSERRAT
jgi:hypothetical protein